MTDKSQKNSPLLPFWLDEQGRDRTAEYNVYRFCQQVEDMTGARLGTGRTPQSDPVRFHPHPGMGFPAGELRRTQTDEENPDAPPVVRTNFLGLYGVDSPLPTAIVDDITQDREGSDATAAFLDIFNHRFMTQFYRIWRKYNYPASFEPGGTDNISRSLMALTGVTQSATQPPSRLLALLQPMLMPTHTAEAVAAIIRSLAPDTTVTVTPHLPVMMPVEQRARLSIDSPMTLGEHPVLGDKMGNVNYCMRVEMATENREEAKGWMPGGQLKKDVFALLRTYLGCDYDARLHLTIPTKLLPVPRLGDANLFSGYNIMLGLRDDNHDVMPKTARIRVGNLRAPKAS